MKIILVFLLLSFGVAFPAVAFPPDAGKGSCTDCHSLTVEEASTLLSDGVDRVLGVTGGEVPGMWVVDVEKNRQKFPIYVDYSKKYVFTGNIIRLKDHQNITAQHAAQLNRVDVARIPIDDALLLGSKTARTKVIVITDPDCPFCKRLHDELKEVVRRDPQIAFLIKFYPLKIHPNAYEISKSIVCAQSLDLLEAHFAGKPIPPATCNTRAIDENIALVQQLGITATPALILPDGLVQPGFKSADDILRLLGSRAVK